MFFFNTIQKKRSILVQQHSLHLLYRDSPAIQKQKVFGQNNSSLHDETLNCTVLFPKMLFEVHVSVAKVLKKNSEICIKFRTNACELYVLW